MSRLWGRLTHVLLGVNVLSAVVFFVVAVVWAATGFQAVQFVATPFTVLALGVSNLMFLVAAFSPRVPLRVAAPLFLWQWYLALGAMPFGVLGIVNHWSIVVLGLLSLVVMAGVVGLARTVRPALLERRAAFSPLRGLVVLGITVLCAPVAVAAYSMGSAAWTLDYATDGYAGLTMRGFVIRGRTFERAETRVVLQGMMHIGEGSTYQELYASFGAQPSTVVLTEGVSDANGALGKGGIGYTRVAERLGVVQQGAIEEDGFIVRNADVDVSEFSEETLELLRGSLGVWASDDPVQAWISYSLRFSTRDPDALYATLYQDVVLTRNDEVLREVALAEPEFSHIFVPWGAAHLPGIEAALVGDGWHQIGESERVLVAWSTVGSAFW